MKLYFGGLYVNLFTLRALLSALLFTSLLFPFSAIAQEQQMTEEEEEAAYEAQLKLGEEYYSVNCRMCHGKDGDGKGFVATIKYAEKKGRVLTTYPRDFTVGLYRFRSTSTGCLPDDQDLKTTIKGGITQSFMPPQDGISDEELAAIVEYIKTFSLRFEDEDPCDVIAAKKPGYVGSDKSIDKGKVVYNDMKCWECHGQLGAGDGPKSLDIKDDWGQQLLPFDFVTGELKRGSTPENIYMTFTAGLDGTGMPSYEDSLSEEQRWNLVSYTLKLMGKIGANKDAGGH